MLSANELKLDHSNNPARLPLWISSPDRPALQLWGIANAKTVMLRSGAQRIAVKVREYSSLFVGEISAFEPHVAGGFKGMQIGELIVFKREHIVRADE